MNDRNNPTPHLAGAKIVADQHLPQTLPPGKLPNGKPASGTPAPESIKHAQVDGEWAYERLLWSLWEISWSDIWNLARQWELRLRPDSLPLARAWFAAWIVTGLSGAVLVLSLLLTPTPRTPRSNVESMRSGRFSVEPNRRNRDSQPKNLVLPAASSNSTDARRVRHADYETDLLKSGLSQPGHPPSAQIIQPSAPPIPVTNHPPASAPVSP